MSGLRLVDERTPTGFEGRTATQRRDAIGAGAHMAEEVALEQRERLREG